jgi:Aspartyl/Asparaginyl beta-hydroxylase
MNLENLINKYKITKYQEPKCAVKIKDLDPNTFHTFKTSILDSYDLTDPKYSTKEWVFLDTRRIVAANKYHPLKNQLFTELDFDQKLSKICTPIVEHIQQQLIGYVPVVTQLATLLPQQKLQWHIDVFLYQQFTNKIHIPIVSNPNSFFDVFWDNNVSRVNMPETSVWNINNLALHRSINLGTQFRTHLIIDFIKQDTIEELTELGVNVFHTKIPEVSAVEEMQKIMLRKKYN